MLRPSETDPPAVVGLRCEVLRFGQNEWATATLIWSDPALDLAVIAVDGVVDVPPLRWGRLQGAEPVKWWAAGYPFASLDASGRQIEQVFGNTSKISQMDSGKLALSIGSRDAAEQEAGSGWRGLSGAAVFCRSWLVGVVIADPSKYRESLTGRRLDTVAADEGFRVALGVDVAIEIDDIFEDDGPRGPSVPEGGGLDIHTRPPAATSTFRDRLAQTRQLVEKLKEEGRSLVVITGRPAIGKTALVARVFELLEKEKPPPAMHAIYLSASGTVPLSPDLVCASLRASWGSIDVPGQDVASLISRRKAPTLLVIDQVEALLKEGCDWADPAFGTFVTDELRRAQGLKLVIVSTEEPTTASVGERPVLVKLSEGLPSEDAIALLCDSDPDGSLGLRGNDGVTGKLVEAASGHPRILELILSTLQDNPLLTPQNLLDSLVADVAGDLLRKSYANLSPERLPLLGVLAVSGRPVPLAIAEAAAGPRAELDEAIGLLARRHLIKVDRIGQQIWLDRLDASFVLSSVLDAEQVVDSHLRVARAAVSGIRSEAVKDTEADVWLIASVDHLVSAGAGDEASDLLLDEMADRLEAHGLYDQLLRLHERVNSVAEAPNPARATRLVRLHALTGSLVLARETAEAYLREAGQADPEFWAQFATVLSNCDLASQAAEAFRNVLRGRASAVVSARAQIGLAQVARRKGYLRSARSWLERALLELDEEHQARFAHAQLAALAHHHLAGLDRWKGSPTSAAASLDRSMEISVSSGDRGGEAYRLTLGAALASDRLEIGKAANLVFQAIQIYDEVHDDWGKAAALYTLAVMQADLGQYEAARQSAIQARSLGEATNNTRAAQMVRLVELTCARRDPASGPDIEIEVVLAEVAEAESCLRRSGFNFYADQMAMALELNARIVGASHPPGEFHIRTRLLREHVDRWPEQPHTVDEALAMLRPLRNGPLDAPVPAGMRADLDRLVR